MGSSKGYSEEFKQIRKRRFRNSRVRAKSDAAKNEGNRRGKRNIKKSYHHIREKITVLELSNIVKEQEMLFEVNKMCKLFGICRSSYYYCT